MGVGYDLKSYQSGGRWVKMWMEKHSIWILSELDSLVIIRIY